MSGEISIEHVSLGLLGPIPHTRTRAMPIHCVIFQIDERIILLDSGFGCREMEEPNTLVGFDAIFKLGFMTDRRMTAAERLRARGIRPDQVTDIILTHMDNDHAGGLHDFPNALVHLSEEELNGFDSTRARGPYKPYQISHRTRFETYSESGEEWFGLCVRSLNLPGDLQAKLVPMPGHTAGHCGVAYRENDRWSLHAGDAYFDSVINFIPNGPALPIEAAFQTDATQRIDTLRKLHRLKAEYGDDVSIFCTHDEREFANWTRSRGKPDPIVDALF